MKKIHFYILILISVLTAKAQSIQWLDTLKYSSNTTCTGLSTDSAGNVYTAGNFNPGQQDASPQGIFVSKYDSLGNLLWTDNQNNGGLSSRGMVADKKGNTYAVFSTQGVATFGSYSFNNPKSAMMLVKYSSGGTVQWVKRVDKAGVKGICMDKQGMAVYVYGGAQDSASFDGYTQSGFGNYIARYDTNGTCGFLLSTGQFVGNVSVDGLGNMFLVDEGGLKKYNSAGVLQWVTYSYNGVVYADMYGNCYLRSNFGGSVTFGNTTLTNPYTNGAVQSFLAKIDATGNYVWAIAPTDPLYFRNIFLTASDVYITGNTGNDDPWGIHSGFIAKYDTAGNKISQSTFIQNNNSAFVNVSSKGGKYLAGNSWGQGCVAFITKVSSYGTFTGIKKRDDVSAGITIYPNPTDGIITIKSGSLITKGELRVENVLGQLVYTKKITTNGTGIDETVNLSQYPKGIYFVQINTGSVSEVRKIVLE